MSSDAGDPRTYTISEAGGRGRACLNVTLAGEQVSSVTYRPDSDTARLELVQVETPPAYERQGHARHALRHLVAAFPEMHVINSPAQQNSDEGEALIAALRAEGVPIHEFGCFRDGLACRCGLDVAL